VEQRLGEEEDVHVGDSGPAKTEMLNGPFPKAKVWKCSHSLPSPFQQDPGHWWGNTSVQEPGIRLAPDLRDTQR